MSNSVNRWKMNKSVIENVSENREGVNERWSEWVREWITSLKGKGNQGDNPEIH